MGKNIYNGGDIWDDPQPISWSGLMPTLPKLQEQAIYYDKEIMKAIFDPNPLFSFVQEYKSNWRMLHIDGFEGKRWLAPRLPIRRGEMLKFFQYEIPTSDLSEYDEPMINQGAL